jgi:cysteine dioxygenase
VKTRNYPVGSVIGSFDEQIHQMGNLRAAGDDLVTLHVYSPPLLHMRTYFLGNAILGEGRRAARAANSSRIGRASHS